MLLLLWLLFFLLFLFFSSGLGLFQLCVDLSSITVVVVVIIAITSIIMAAALLLGRWQRTIAGCLLLQKNKINK